VQGTPPIYCDVHRNEEQAVVCRFCGGGALLGICVCQSDQVTRRYGWCAAEGDSRQ
jgi:hypothetical protein